MATQKRTTILLIEDSPSDTRLIKESLRDAPHGRFSVITASTLAEGLSKLEQAKIDAILLDLALPDSDGIATFHAVRKLTSLPIVVLTMTDDDVLGLQMVHEGAQDYLPKTVLTQAISTTALTRAIRYAIERMHIRSELRHAHEQMETLNERLQSANKQLRIVNEELSDGVSARTEELDAANEGLRVTNEELRREVEHRTHSERVARQNAERTELINRIITLGNEFADMRSYVGAMLDLFVNELAFDTASVRFREGDVIKMYDSRGFSAELVTKMQEEDISTSPFNRIYAGEPYLDEAYADTDPAIAREARIETALGIPLIAYDRIIGHFGLGSRRKRPFTNAELQTLIAIGQQAGTVISRLQAEEALKEGETRYRRLVERSFDAVIIHSDGVIRFANDAAARILKAEYPADLVGMNILDLPSPRFQELAKERMSSVYTTKQSSEPAEFEYRALDGMIIETEVMGTPITYDNKPAIYVVFRDISERKRMEAQLKQYSERLEALVEERTAQLAQREESFRTLFEASSVGQIHYDANGHPTRINRAAATFFGINDVSDIQHLTIFSSPQTSEGDKARLRAGRPVRYEHVYDFKEITERGSFHTTRSDVRYVDLYMLPIFNTLGDSVEGYLAQLVDITELKQVEAALQASEAEYRTLVETANSSIFTLDTEGTITYVNEFGAHSLGYTPDELIGQNVMVIVPDVESSGRDMTPYIDDIVARPDDHTLSVNENITKDGRRLWFNWVNKILTDEEGRHIGHLAMGYDVTEQLRAQQALQDSEERYRTLVETAHSVILTVDNHGIVTFINDYGARFFGYMPDELIGKHTMILVPPVDSSGHDLTAHINDVIAHPDQHTVSLNENITKDGRRVLVNWVNHILTDEEGRHIGHLTMGYDVTEQKETEDKLHDAQRLAGIGQTAAMIGHDLRNPLQSLQYIVDLQKLRFDKIPPDKRSAEDWQKEEALFDYISEQVFYMDKIVSDLSDYARPIAPEHEEITIRTIIDDVLESIPPADGVEIVVDVRDQTFTVDPHLMVRVFSNLILNALQAMPHGGTLTIETEAFNDSVTIRVSDTGVGIPADMRDKLFSPLTTGKAKGTGLGLAVVKRIVEAHKGTITFESEKGKGTAFAVTLPAT